MDNSTKLNEYAIIFRTDTGEKPLYTTVLIGGNHIPTIDLKHILKDMINDTTRHICDEVISVYSDGMLVWNDEHMELVDKTTLGLVNYKKENE